VLDSGIVAGGRFPRGGLGEAVANVLLLLLSVAFVLLVAEAGARAFSRIGPALLVADPLIGKRYVAGYEGRVFVDEAGGEVPLRFNREGFRSPDHPRAKPAGTVRIAVVGDSMIAAVATPEQRTLVRLLESSLQHRGPGARHEVLNFGVSSSSTGQELALYRHLVSRYAPDVVVLAFFVGNDFADNSRRLTSAPRIYFDLESDGRLEQVSAPPAPGALSLWLNLHSRFYVWQKLAFRLLRDSTRALAGGMHPGERVFERSNDPDLAHAWALLAALLGQFRAEVERDGSRLVLVVIPCAEQVHDDLWAELAARATREARAVERDLPQRRLAAITRSAAIPTLDLTPAFLGAAAGQPATAPGSPYLHGRFHLSDLGNRLAADELLRFLTSGDPPPLASRAPVGSPGS
jgi:hypothetical protein